MIDIVQESDVFLVAFRPSDHTLDDAAVEDVAGQLLRTAAADPPRLVLDLGEVRFFGSSFIELMFRAWKRLKERNGAMVLCCLHPHCAEVLKVTKLDTLWPICATREDAAAAAQV
jgi:stage II sporulation protein AA (anti-sigma F factor antagonist)